MNAKKLILIFLLCLSLIGCVGGGKRNSVNNVTHIENSLIDNGAADAETDGGRQDGDLPPADNQ